VSGTLFNPKELKISINVNSKSAGNRIDYYVDTELGECNITALFVPTIEIAKILYKYKNSVLKFNPRSYLELSAGSVNKRIQESITTKDSNEFALFNNGITMLSDSTYYSDRVGRKGEAEVLVTNPQIINGGQTAFTLSRIYEEKILMGQPLDVFDNKEVFLKVITFSEDGEAKIEEKEKLLLIEAISKATNDQTEVTEADRRSNEKIQIELQEKIFKDFGYFYERKRGEFGDGIRNKYIDRHKVIEREGFLRLCISINGNPGQARRASSRQIFMKDSFNDLFDSGNYRKYFFGFKAFEYLNEIQRKFERDVNNRFGQAQYGYGLRYGKVALVSIITKKFQDIKLSENEFEISVKAASDQVLNLWFGFEDYVRKQPANTFYFRTYEDPETGQEIQEVNFDNYYKGRTVGDDLKQYFNKKLSK
jgi:hypothetical protein